MAWSEFHSLVELSNIPLCEHRICWSVCPRLGHFHLSANAQCRHTNVCVQISVRVSALGSLGYRLGSGIPGWYGHSVLSCLRNPPTVSAVTCTTYAPTRCARGFRLSTPSQHLLFHFFSSEDSHPSGWERVLHDFSVAFDLMDTSFSKPASSISYMLPGFSFLLLWLSNVSIARGCM